MKKNMNLKILNEIVNDAFWLGYILEIKKHISNYNKKEILSSFLVFYSSIFVEETLKANYGGLNKDRNITLEDIEKFRNYNLKHYPSLDSRTTKRIMKEMEIEFEPNVFDIVLYANNSKIIDINFREWDLANKEKFELYDSLIATPYRWLQILIPDILNKVLEMMEELTHKYIAKLSKMNIDKKSYSTYRLFKKKKITDSEKVYILERYGLVKTTMFIDEILEDKISFDVGKLHFDSTIFMRKIKAIIMEMMWNDKQTDENNSIIDKIFEKNEKSIAGDFYHINRKCRNNLHYCDYNCLSKKDNEILDKYQNKYLNNIIETFDSYIFIKFGLSYNLSLLFAKLEYWSRSR